MRKHVLAIATAAIAVFGGLTSAASADQLQSQDPSTLAWSAVGTGTSGVLSGSLASSSALLETDLGNVSCTVSTVGGSVTANGGVGNTTNVTGGITSLTFTSCTDDSSLFNLRNCTNASNPVIAYASTSTPFGVTADADVSPDLFALANINVDVCIDPVLGSNADCKYTGTANGSIVGSQVIFDLEPVTSTTGFPCPSSSTFTATYNVRHDHDNNAGTAGRVVRLVD